jgi:WhiB family redox-sensing transcriptional regulator
VLDKRWRRRARCRPSDASDLFVRGRLQQEAKLFCTACPVRVECLAHALDHQVEYGVWGGLTERERRVLLRSNPHIRSWAEVFESSDKVGNPV